MDPNALTLRLDSGDYRGWTSVGVTRSLEAAVASFALSLTESWPGAVDPVGVKPTMPCEVLIGSDRVIAGYVDRVEVSHDKASHEITITGRSKTQDLVDCSVIMGNGEQLLNQTILQIAQVLAAPYGVDVVAEVPLTDKIKRFAPETGEAVFEAVERLARDAQVLITDDADGRMVLTQAGATGTAGALSHPGNVISARGSFDASSRFSWYCLKGQRAGDDYSFGVDAAQAVAVLSDDDVIRRRVLVLRGDRAMDAASCKRRATWEAVTRAGRSVAVEVIVAGWRDVDGALWATNRLVPVVDDVIGVDATLLIVSVAFSIDRDGGLVTTLTLAPPGGYEPEPPAERAKSKKGKITKGIRAWKPWIVGGV